MTTPDAPDLLMPHEVAALFRVDTKTVQRWGAQGRLRSIRTPGGHRRYFADHVAELLRADGAPERET